MDNQLNFFANASLSAEPSTDWPRRGDEADRSPFRGREMPWPQPAQTAAKGAQTMPQTQVAAFGNLVLVS
jgi:hypothetical protein